MSSQMLRAHISRHLVVELLVVVFAFFASQPAFALPKGYESYEERPDILTLPARPRNEDWSAIREAHFAFIAQLLETYPTQPLYFLARDSEYLYDTARLITNGDPRIRLLNVSRSNMRDPHLREYLSEHGLTEESLTHQAILVDTGFAGTIPRVIGELFSKNARRHLHTQLLVSDNTEHPSSRLFLGYLNPAVNETSPSKMHATIVSYEHMERYTDRSDRFVLENGKYIPVSPVVTAALDDGKVSKSLATSYMMDLVSEWSKPHVKEEFEAMRARVRLAANLIHSAAIKPVKDFMTDERTRSIVRDRLDYLTTLKAPATLTFTDLGFKAEEAPLMAGKNWFIKKYPQWAPYIEDPVAGIPKLFAEEKWQTIAAMIDVKIDWEVDSLLVKYLFDGTTTGPKRALQIAFVESKGVKEGSSFSSEMRTFENQLKDKLDWPLIEVLLLHADSLTKSSVINIISRHELTDDDLNHFKAIFAKAPRTEATSNTFALMFTKGDRVLKMIPEYTQMIEHSKAGSHGLGFITMAFTDPRMRAHPELLEMILHKNNPDIIRSASQYVFSHPEWSDREDLMRYAIEHGAQGTVSNFMYSIFTKPYMQGRDELLKLAFAHANGEARSYFKHQVLANGHYLNHSDLYNGRCDSLFAR